MEKKSIYIIQGIIFIGLLFGTGVTQLQLKSLPLVIMLIIGILTTVSFFMRQKSLFNILFYILLWIMLFINFSMLTHLIVDLFNPGDGWVQFQGESHRVMETNWVWGAMVGFALSSLSLILYHKTKMNNQTLEVLMIVALIAISVINLL